jgi:hypothetical protein
MKQKFNNLKITIMKKMNKVIAVMMLMAITFATPAKAGNKKPNNHGKNDKVVVVNNDKKDSHFDKVDKRTSHFYAHKTHASRPDMKTCTVHLSRFDSPRAAMERAERIHGVAEVKYNPRTREITVLYDAKVTSSRHIRHAVA